MRRALLLLLLLPGLAWAKVARVASGDHPGFARLVLPLPAGAEWSLAPRPGGVELLLPPDTSFDLGDAFRLIGRDRVAGLEDEGGGRLAVEVGCDCHAKAFLYDEAWVVLDVVDGPAPEGVAGVVSPGAPLGGAAEAVALRLPSGGTIPLLPDPAPRAPTLGPLAAGRDLPRDAAPGDGPAEDRRATDAARLAATEAAMLEGLAAAASQGFLDLSSLRDLPSPEPEAPAPGAPPPAAAGPSAAPEASPGIALRTASTRAAAPPLGATGEACLPPEEFDLAAWAPSGDFGAEIGRRTLALTDARDRLDPEGIEALARAYLHFGFGREARATLGLDGRRSRGRDLLLLLAALVDGEPASPDALGGQAGCAGPQALWRALARGTLDGTAEAERTAVETALRALPAPLRDPLAARVAALFAAAGEPLTAGDLLAEAPPSPEALVVAADVAGAVAGPEARLDALEAAAEDPRQGAGALDDLVDLAVAEGRVLPEATLDLLAARRFEMRGTADGALLRRAEARALAQGDRFDEALALVADGEGDLSAPERDALLAEILAGASSRLPDADFAELALDRLPPRLSARALAPVAARLEALGFPEEAGRLRERAVAPEGGSPPAAGIVDRLGQAGAGQEGAEEPAPDLAPGPDAEAPALAGAGPEPPSDAEPDAAASAALPAGPPSLAGSRALLDGAAAARDRALTLLGAPAEAPPGG